MYLNESCENATAVEGKKIIVTDSDPVPYSDPATKYDVILNSQEIS